MAGPGQRVENVFSEVGGRWDPSEQGAGPECKVGGARTKPGRA